MEDEKQLRILNALFIPLSQAMPALAASGDQEMIGRASKAMAYLVKKQIELSGASAAMDIGLAFDGDPEKLDERDAKIAELEEKVHSEGIGMGQVLEMNENALLLLQEQMRTMMETQQVLMEKLGVPNATSAVPGGESQGGLSTVPVSPPTVLPASA
jgi:hypothetical protein